MLCEIDQFGNFFTTWAALTLLAFISLMVMSTVLFLKYYVKPSFETWRWKSNPSYPSPVMVRQEIVQMVKGLWSASLCPTLALFLARNGTSKAYCGMGPNGQDYGFVYLAATWFGCWLAFDAWEWFYHRLGHTTAAGWEQHKYHHLFYNPSPFAVIADEYMDQFMRASPLLVTPLLFPVNIDMLFFMFAVFFYAYGVYLHWGYELESLDAHHPYINTAFQHYAHHAISVRNKPYYTGFMLKLWDNLAGSVYKGKCFCVRCEQKAGKRTVEKYREVVLPDYSVLLQPSFWCTREAWNFETYRKDVK